MYTLTDEQKEQVLAEVAHYLEMDCYDFGVSVGPFSLLAGELAEQAESAMMELDGGFEEDPPKCDETRICMKCGAKIPESKAIEWDWRGRRTFICPECYDVENNYYKEEDDGICVDGGSRPDGAALQNGEQHPQAGKRQVEKADCRTEARAAQARKAELR